MSKGVGWGRVYWMKNGARPTEVFVSAQRGRKESKKNVEKLFSFTQRWGLCILQEDCLDQAIILGWRGFSCINCPLRHNQLYQAKIKDLRGRIPLEKV